MTRHRLRRVLALTGALTVLLARDARAQQTFPNAWVGRWVGTPTTYAPVDPPWRGGFPRMRNVLLAAPDPGDGLAAPPDAS